MSDGVETGRAPVDRVQLHQHSNQRFGDGPMKVGIRLPIQREILIQHQAAAALHHVERCADHLHVLAQDKWLWSEREARVEALEDVELARHVVRPWRHRTGVADLTASHDHGKAARPRGTVLICPNSDTTDRRHRLEAARGGPPQRSRIANSGTSLRLSEVSGLTGRPSGMTAHTAT